MQILRLGERSSRHNFREMAKVIQDAGVQGCKQVLQIPQVLLASPRASHSNLSSQDNQIFFIVLIENNIDKQYKSSYGTESGCLPQGENRKASELDQLGEHLPPTVLQDLAWAGCQLPTPGKSSKH